MKKMKQTVVFSINLEEELAIALSECEHDKTFVLTDENTAQLCWTVVEKYKSLDGAKLITIGSGDSNKNVETLAHVWRELGEGGATRHSCLINLGGGMVTDLGGFAASTFKRGINFINVPTTLLAMVDASVGGKTGINFNGLKNEIGVFNVSRRTILDTYFLATCDERNMLSGYAEMIKHGLISNETHWAELLSFDMSSPDLSKLAKLLETSVKVKERIVEADPTERGLRKILNFGHTFGHAFESWSLRRRPLLHGYAVAFGMVCELYLSVVKVGLDTNVMRQTIHYINNHYGVLPITCNDYSEIISLMHHDKKNCGTNIFAALISSVGEPKLDVELSEADIREALDFYREGE